jgi:hypothetical protein
MGGISHLYRRGFDICLFCHFEDKSMGRTAKTSSCKGGRRRKHCSASVDNKKDPRLAGSNSVKNFTEIIQLDRYSFPWDYPPAHFLVWHSGNVFCVVRSSNVEFCGNCISSTLVFYTTFSTDSSVGVASVMILFLSAFKDSPLSWVGLSYERINSFHRWIGRLIVCIFLAHGIMMGYLQCVRQGMSFASWIVRTDVRTGVIATSSLLLLLIL